MSPCCRALAYPCPHAFHSTFRLLTIFQAYKARTRLVENTLTQCKWIIAAGVMFNLSLLPSSLMIMYYGEQPLPSDA